MKRRAFLLLCSLLFTDAALAQTTRTPLSQLAWVDVCAAPYNVQVQAQGVDATATGVRMGNVSTVTTTTVSGNVSQAATVSLLGVLSLNLATTGTPNIFIEAWCN